MSHATTDKEREFALLVGAARSGTTLLRFILDAHPAIACPGEAGIPTLVERLANVWAIAHGYRADRIQDLPDWLTAQVRMAARAPMDHLCEQQGKRIYCDKSLDSVEALASVNALFPDAHYILMFRHVMDVIASGLQASPWGFDAYGFVPFVRANPENFVAGLANYWLVHVDAMLRWQERHPELCHRVRYEDLVDTPTEVVPRIFAFLGVEDDPTAVPRAFERAQVGTGPRDFKVGFTDEIHRRSVGRGKQVPVSMIPVPLLDAVNQKLAALDYPPLSPTWNVEPVAVAPETSISADRRLHALMDQAALAVPTDPELGTFALLAADAPHLRWTVDPAGGSVQLGDGEVEAIITGTAHDLVAMLDRTENIGALVRAGRIRHFLPDGNVPLDEVLLKLNRIVRFLHAGESTPDERDTAITA